MVPPSAHPQEEPLRPEEAPRMMVRSSARPLEELARTARPPNPPLVELTRRGRLAGRWTRSRRRRSSTTSATCWRRRRRSGDEYLDLARRTKADFENYRKRMAADVQAALKRGKGEMAGELIDAVDNMERALESAGEGSDGLTGGVEMVLRGLREALSRNGIEAVEPKGEKFDPNQHEALSTMPVEGAEPGVVVEVVQKGYRLDDQLLRPARVVVSA